jgi:ABC-type branched-subunit amino acid transport system substrate-binding protein
MLCLFCSFAILAFSPSPGIAVNASFDAKQMGDMSDFDPNNPKIPTGDTIKIAIVASFSGPAALVGQIYYISVLWAAHDINKGGGFWLTGKRS